MDKKQKNKTSFSHYYSEKQSGNFVKKEIKARLLGNDIVLKTGSGVFSKDRVDKGTLLLIDSCILNKGSDSEVLDLGAGIGVVGIAVAKKYGCHVAMVEINKRACELSKENVLLNKLKDKVDVYHGSMLEPVHNKIFDAILLNPPQTAGRDICIKMIDQSYNRLRTGGTLQMVARHNKGGETLSRHMSDVFGNVREIAKKAGYRVYLSQKI